MFVSHPLCPCYRFLWGKYKELQRTGRVNQVFFSGDIVTITITENSPVIKILHEKDLVVCQECPQESVWKIISISQLLLTSGSIAQIFDFCQLHFKLTYHWLGLPMSLFFFPFFWFTLSWIVCFHSLIVQTLDYCQLLLICLILDAILLIQLT